MGLGRIDKLQLLTRTCTKPTQSDKCIVGTLLVLGWTMGNSNTQDSPRPGLGGSHHLPPYSIFYTSPQGPHPNGFLSQDSQVGVLKFQQLGLPPLWERITSYAKLRLWWGLKKHCSPRQGLSNDVLHVACMQGNWVDSRLLVVGNQTTNLTPDLSFRHNLCCKCPNGSCEPIFDIYTSLTFSWYKERLNARCFDPCNQTLKFWESRQTPKSPF
jgi:hypothetical protein